MPIPTIQKICLNLLLDGGVVEIFSEKARDKSVAILKNHFLSATEINKALQDSYTYALAAISAGLASPDDKLKFRQKFTQTQIEPEFVDKIENDYLQPFLAEHPPRSLHEFRADGIKQCKALTKQSFQATAELTESDLVAIISYKGSFAITDLVIQEWHDQKLDDEFIAFLRYNGLLGNAILFFFLEQLRENPRVKYTHAALQDVGLWADMRDLNSAQKNLSASLEQQQTAIRRQLSEQKRWVVPQQIMAKIFITPTKKRMVEARHAKTFEERSQELQRLKQQAEAIQDLLDNLPQRLQKAQATWSFCQEQLTQLTAGFQTWAPIITEKADVVLTWLDEIGLKLDNMDNKLEQLLELMGILNPRDEFIQYDSIRLKNLEDEIAEIKRYPQYRSQVAIIEGCLCASQGDLQAAEQKFIQARDANDEKRALACFNLFQVRLRHQNYPEALAALQETYSKDEYALHDIDKYPIEKILGADGMGCVFLCQDQWRENQVVVKTFWEGRRDDVFKELIIMHHLSRAYIAKPLDYGYVNSVKQERPYFVREYVEGAIDGETWVKKHGKLKLLMGLKVALQMAKGLAVAHQAGVYHLDLKPASILLKADEVKIIDFGLARVATSLKQQVAMTEIRSQTSLLAQSVFETLDYAAPEQRGGESNAKSDIFAFGATMYYLLSGENPRSFHRSKLPEVPELQALLSDCLETEPEKRPEMPDIIRRLSSLLDKIEPALTRELAPQHAEEYKKIEAEIAIPEEEKLFDFEIVTLNAKGKIRQRERKSARYQTEDLGKGVILEMVYIEGGTFVMGSPKTEKERKDREGPQHEVTLESFYMSKYLVTQAQWKAVMGNNPSYFKGDKRPVENISWQNAVEFCKRLSKMTGKTYRLQSEVEWEYACRAGTTTPFYFGETVTTDFVNYDGNYSYTSSVPKGIYREETTEVGSFPPNAFGLYDMHGNVWEWCAEPWHENYEAAIEGRVWEKGKTSSLFVLRGGSWFHDAGKTRSAFRGRAELTECNGDVGFRVVRIL
jgi:formylglycine-generating enzyme required for sulfatase activity/uncharacterized protein YukE